MTQDIKRDCKSACKKLSYKGDISYARGYSLKEREIGVEYLFVSDVIGTKTLFKNRSKRIEYCLNFNYFFPFFFPF